MYTRLSHDEYKELSARTVSPNFWVTDKVNIAVEEGRIPELHMSIGLVTEVQEIMLAILKPHSEERTVNIGEEIADAWWYVSGIERMFGFNLSNYQPSMAVHSPMNLVVELIKDSVDVLDLYKKSLFYNKEVNVLRIHSLMVNTVNTLVTLTNDFGLETEVIKAKNINKLYVRFPEKFTNQNAQERDLDKEYQALK